MMVAMMVPSATPTVLLVTALAWDRLDNSNLVPATAMLFASGYLVRVQRRCYLVAVGSRRGRTIIQEDGVR
jgi:predicted metal-binding membrane protein